MLNNNLIIDDIEKAWRVLQEAPVILNLDNGLVPAKVFNKNNIYLAASSDYKKVSRSSLVNPCISDDFRNLLVEGFKIPEFDNFQYVKESIVAKYITTADVVSTIHVDDDEYTDDLNQIISLMNQTNDIELITNMVKDAAIIRIS